MNQLKLSESILKKIKQEKITPRSKYFFIFKNISFWMLFILAIILGAISFSIILFSLKNTDFDIFDSLCETTGISHLLNLLPLLWILFIGIAIGLGIWGLQHTKRGYKIALSIILGGNILGSIFLGSFVYGMGGGEKLEEIFEDKIPIYQGIRKKHQKIWGHPEVSGRLAGMVESVNKENQTLILSDPYGRTREINYKNSQNFEPQVGQVIKMKGQIDKNGKFSIQRIRQARRQKKIQQKIRQYFKKHPELKRKFKQRVFKHLSPKTQQKIKKIHQQGKNISPNFRRKIRQEIRRKRIQN